jgi:thiosulfate/3-mercaptopyruvate sulfurtransferase
MYKGFLVDKNLLTKDPHFLEGCVSCHGGNEKALKKETAHKGKVSRPSDNLTLCGKCHGEIAKTYKSSLHFTTAGLRNGVKERFSKQEMKVFDKKVFEKSCRSCHASCGDCHIKGPAISGISVGLIKGHKFVKRDEGKTCNFCHGGRVYPEFTGEYGGTPDVHYQKGMVCIDCHNKSEFHGDGKTYTSRKEIPDKPACIKCHETEKEGTEQARLAHSQHKDKLSCSACHSSGPYRNCYECHLGKGATPKPAFILGRSPRDKSLVTPLRIIPTVRDTFNSAGIKMEHYDALPNYWDAFPHNIRKRTERTRSCEVCHEERKDFLTKDLIIPKSSKANEGLVVTPKSIK